MTYWRAVISFIKADIYEPSRAERPNLPLQVYGAWIVTLFQLSASSDCAECLNIKRKGHSGSLVVVQSERGRVGLLLFIIAAIS